jgi:hypothetical protein
LMKIVSVVLSLSFAALLFFHLPASASAGARTIDNPAGVGAKLPRLTTLQNGSTLLSWIDGRADKQSNAKKFSLRYAKLDYNGKLGPEEMVDGDTCTCCWTSAAVTPSGPIAAWRGRRDGKIRDHYAARMVGDKWTSPVKLGQEGWSIDGCPVNGPALATYGNQVVAAWFTAEGNKPRVRMAFSSNAGQHFFSPVNVDVDRPIGRVSVAWLDQSTALVAWLTKVEKIRGWLYARCQQTVC